MPDEGMRFRLTEVALLALMSWDFDLIAAAGGADWFRSLQIADGTRKERKSRLRNAKLSTSGVPLINLEPFSTTKNLLDSGQQSIMLISN